MINLLKILSSLILASIIFLIPQAFAQISIGSPAEQDSVNITINEDGDVHVVHLVIKSEKNIQVELIAGTVENLEVKDGAGNQIQHALSGNSVVTLFPPDVNFAIEYDLEDALSLKDGVWTWDYLYTQHQSSVFIFPDGVDLVFANERPVSIKNAEGVNCHGCQMLLEYVVDEPMILNEVEWEGQKFPVLIRTLDEITSFNFDQLSRKISLETNGNKFVTLIIPLKLLWNPYEVYLDDEKILKHEFSQNDTHVWLNIKPKTTGTVEIIGISAIPEFSIFLPLVLGIATIVGLQFKNKINLR